jgi:hypothetical protein
LHFGWGTNLDGPDHFKDCIVFIKFIDYLLFDYSKKWDKDEERRALYGQRGAFRPKPYGVEYRSLSNAWVTHSDSATIMEEMQGYLGSAIHHLMVSNSLSPEKVLETNDVEILKKYFESCGLGRHYFSYKELRYFSNRGG